MAKEAQSEQARISACNALLERAYGRSQASQLIEIDLPEISTLDGITKAFMTIIRVTTEGKLTPAEAHSLSTLMEMQRKAIETTELETGSPLSATEAERERFLREAVPDLKDSDLVTWVMRLSEDRPPRL